jgi:hypothetical protein
MINADLNSLSSLMMGLFIMEKSSIFAIRSRELSKE